MEVNLMAGKTEFMKYAYFDKEMVELEDTTEMGK